MKKKKVNIKFSTKDFKIFLKSISKINTSFIIKIKDKVATIFTSGTVSPIIVLAELKLDISEDIELDLPISDISVLLKICEFASSDIINLEVDDNIVKFDDNGLKFKFHLADSQIISLPKNVTVEKFKSFKTSYQTHVDKANIAKLEKGISLIKSSNIKVYFYTREDGFYGELTDKETALMDSFAIRLTDDTTNSTGILNGDIPVSLDTWTLINLLVNPVTFSVSTVQTRLGVTNILFITQETDSMKCTYLIQALKHG